MKLNEDGTITLSQRETQQYATKIINPKYQELKRYTEFYKRASERDVNNVLAQIGRLVQIINTFTKELTTQNKITQPQVNRIHTELERINWMLNREKKSFTTEEEQEIEQAYNLYKMLLKHRRLINDE